MFSLFAKAHGFLTTICWEEFTQFYREESQNGSSGSGGPFGGGGQRSSGLRSS
jgi:hypothetical protein